MGRTKELGRKVLAAIGTITLAGIGLHILFSYVNYYRSNRSARSVDVTGPKVNRRPMVDTEPL